MILRPRPARPPVESIAERRATAAARATEAKERADRITARAVEAVEVVTLATSASRPSVNREDVIQKLASTTWLGRVVALQGLLRIVSKMSLSMQTVNVIPWELMSEQRDFYDKLVSMQSALREQPKETDPRWRSTPPDPIPTNVTPFFHEEPDPKLLGQSWIQQLIAGLTWAINWLCPVLPNGILAEYTRKE